MATQRTLRLDFDAVAIADMEDLEASTGMLFQDVVDQWVAAKQTGALPPMTFFRPIAFLALRQSNPDATWEEAGRVRIGELDLKGMTATPLQPLAKPAARPKTASAARAKAS